MVPPFPPCAPLAPMRQELREKHAQYGCILSLQDHHFLDRCLAYPTIQVYVRFLNASVEVGGGGEFWESYLKF